MMYAAAAADFVIDRKIKNLTSTCITFSQHRNPKHQKKRLKSKPKSKVKLTSPSPSPSPQNLDLSPTQHCSIHSPHLPHTSPHISPCISMYESVAKLPCDDVTSIHLTGKAR